MTDIFKGEGKVLYLAPTGGAAVDAPVAVGKLTGVALETIGSGDSGSVAVEGIYDLSVCAINDSGNSAVAIGDAIYYDADDTPKLSKKSTSNPLFGIALEAITSGATDTIKVLLRQSDH